MEGTVSVLRRLGVWSESLPAVLLIPGESDLTEGGALFGTNIFLKFLRWFNVQVELKTTGLV